MDLCHTGSGKYRCLARVVFWEEKGWSCFCSFLGEGWADWCIKFVMGGGKEDWEKRTERDNMQEPNHDINRIVVIKKCEGCVYVPSPSEHLSLAVPGTLVPMILPVLVFPMTNYICYWDACIVGSCLHLCHYSGFSWMLKTSLMLLSCLTWSSSNTLPGLYSVLPS